MSEDNYFDLVISELPIGGPGIKGIEFGLPPTQEMVQQHLEDWGPCVPLVRAAVKDNGHSGDGFFLNFEAGSGPPERRFLFGVKLTLGQAKVLSAALDAAIRMREVQLRANREG